MSGRKIVSEEASIVLVGNFNPKIFHPEWFIRKGIVDEWDYQKDTSLVSSQEYSKTDLSGKMSVQVFLNQFSAKTPLESEFPVLRDLVVHTFTILDETPIQQLGMNYLVRCKFDNADDWREFGRDIAPLSIWRNACGLEDPLEDEKEVQFGLWDITMNIPRTDSLFGNIRPKISVTSDRQRILTFLINSHVELSDDNSAPEVLVNHWESSLQQASAIIKNVLGEDLRKG